MGIFFSWRDLSHGGIYPKSALLPESTYSLLVVFGFLGEEVEALEGLEAFFFGALPLPSTGTISPDSTLRLYSAISSSYRSFAY